MILFKTVRKTTIYKKISLFAVIFTILSGYIFAASSDLPEPTSGINIVRAQGPFIMIDTTGATIDEQYLNQYNTGLKSNIISITKNSPEVKKIEAYLNKRNAPLASEAEAFVEIAKEYNLPYNLMPAISVVESNGGKHTYRQYNYAGMGGQGNAMTFSSWRAAIETHAKILKYGYFDKGANTPEKIEKYYCYNCPTWGEKVSFVMNQIDNTQY